MSKTESATADRNVLDDQEESVRIAVRALGAMRNAPTLSRADSFQTTPALTSASSSPPPSPSMSSSRQTLAEESDFVSRMSHFPLVNSALRAYEKGKASSSVVKYGAEMVESSVMTLSKPVINRLPVNVNQLDEFACRQLDRFDKYRRPSVTNDAHRQRTLESLAIAAESRDNLDVGASTSRNWDHTVPSWIESTNSLAAPIPPTPIEEDRSATPQPEQPLEGNQQVVRRSRWHAVLTEAGGLSAALSEESMRRLKYCLQWLQYATTHIDAQILILRDFIATLHPLPPSSHDSAHPSSPSSPISPTHMRTLTDVRKDVVGTVKQVVEVVSKYAGGALPEPARTHVRGFILKLPQRWATAAHPVVQPPDNSGDRERESVITAAATGGSRRGAGNTTRRQAWRERGTGSESGSRSAVTSPMASRAASPTASPRAAVHRLHPHQQNHPEMTAGTAMVAAQRVLTLATESLDMMRGVTGVVKESLDRADAWVERLRVVGVRQPQSPDNEGENRPLEFDRQRLVDRRELPPLVPSTRSPSRHEHSPPPWDAPSPCAGLGNDISALSLSTPRSLVVSLPEDKGDRKMDVDCI